MESKLIQVVPSIIEKADGVGEFVRSLSESLKIKKIKFILMSLAWEKDLPQNKFFRFYKIGMGLSKLGFSNSMYKDLRAEINQSSSSIIHNHGIWMFPSVYSGIVCRNKKCQLILSPHGTLSEWALSQNKIQKKIFWLLLQKPTLRSVSCFHATSYNEFLDIRKLGFTQPVSIIPIGVKVPPYKKLNDSEQIRSLIFLGRIHPVKGLENLLMAWKKIEAEFPNWRLRIIGKGDGNYLRKINFIKNKHSIQRVFLEETLDGDEKLNAYRKADIFVLPSKSENFGITIAESLAAGTPVIVSKATPWAKVVEKHCGWWVENDEESLAACFREALTLTSLELNEMGRRGHEWIKSDFSWDTISKQFIETYKWTLNGGTPPAWININ